MPIPLEWSNGGMSSTGPDVLFDLEWRKAKRLKYEAGRDKHGPEWAGAHPLIEAHSEAIDMGVYFDQAKKWGVPCEDLELMAHRMRELIRERIRGAGLA